MGLVNFVSTDRVGYNGVSPKNADTLYFVTDERRIYKGDVPFSGGIYSTVAEFPPTGDVNVLYVNTATGAVSYWNGTGYQVVVPATGKTISGTGDDSHIATTKAVVDYVATQVADLDVGAIEGRVDTLETEMDAAQAAITTIQGDGEGSIAKAETDAVAAAKGYTDTEVAKKANLEHTHETADITGLDTALAGKADKAETLAGYGITDAYTKTAADSAIQTAIAKAPHLKREIVEDLPEVAAGDQNTIYMVAVEDGEGNQKYEEFMLINDAFEKIGDSAVDLTGYATETFVTNAIGALDVTDTAVENNYVTQVVQTDGKIAVTRAELPVKSVVEGTANGTIAVNGSDVAVHGLGTAAYTETSAYATAAQGTKADQVFAALTWQEV